MSMRPPRIYKAILTALVAAFASLASPAAAQELGISPSERQVVDASDPQSLSVTIYRDPGRGEGQEMNKDWPRGFAMISETRTVTLPAGQSTIRFEGVAEGMVGVSAIVTGLPGGTIEKNRNAELLSPAALVNGALGNRVTITRTNPVTGEAVPESAIVRTRADGGLVLQTSQGFEAVRCAGLPEKLTFDRIPTGLSAKPVFTIDTRDESGGTYQVVLTYLAWGFDWQANYVATLREDAEAGRDGTFKLGLLSWLTILNDNGQSFDDAELLVIAGSLSIVSDFDALSEEPVAAPMRLSCYPIGSTAAGTPVAYPSPPLPAAMAPMADTITVTGTRRASKQESVAMVTSVMEAVEEQLGDLKLYRVPERVDVSAQGLKQVAFLNRQDVEASYLYRATCGFMVTRDGADNPGFEPTQMLLVTKNEDGRGLGVALPQGSMALFEPSSFGPQLVGDLNMRDYAEDQDIELELGQSNQVFAQCIPAPGPVTERNMRKWFTMRAKLTNANPHSVRVRMDLGESGNWEARWNGVKTRIKDGRIVAEITLPANSERSVSWRIRSAT
ncbi:MAG: hypothetical protein AAGL68_10735 [Pseudomonadota bacterium]